MTAVFQKTLLYISRLLCLTLLCFCYLCTGESSGQTLPAAIPEQDLKGANLSLVSETVSIKPRFESGPASVPLVPLFATSDVNIRKKVNAKYDIYNLYRQVVDKSRHGLREAVSANLIIDGKLVSEFASGEEGIKVDPVNSVKQILVRSQRMNVAGEITVMPKFYRILPDKLLSETNSLGIETLLARGTSRFVGSSKNRRINIRVAAEKLRGILVAPGEVFSFNEHLGDILAKDGFVPEIVIKGVDLKPELGGGVCQVSTTLFRAVVASGMPVVERKNHSFAVNHYSPVGTDATVYAPITDFKFTNDTPAHVLVWPHFPDPDTLYFDFYGTSDGRKVEVAQSPIRFGARPDGGFKTKWTRQVLQGSGTLRDDEFVSNYFPASLFKKEEKFVEAASTSALNNNANTTQPTPPLPPTNNPVSN